MTWRAWSARLTVLSAPARGARVLGDRLGDLAQRVADGVDAVEIPGRSRRLRRDPGPGAVGALVDG